MFTVQDIINQAGGHNALVELGEAVNNKYFKNIEQTVTEQLNWAHYLKLDTTTGLDILEFGTGVGFFPYICDLYNHNCVSTEERGWPNYEPCFAHLNVDPVKYLVSKYESVNNTFDRKFDLVVSFRSFIGTIQRYGGGPGSIDVWDKHAWTFFFKDCAANLLKNDDSMIFFSCNRGDQLPPYDTMPPEEVTIWGSKELAQFLEPYYIPRGSAPNIHGNMFCITKAQINDIP